MENWEVIACSPTEEKCVQLNPEVDYLPHMKAEVTAFMHQLQRAFPDGDFRIQRFEHDFGPYYQVLAHYDDEAENDKRREAAYAAEANIPEYWDEEAKKELTEAGFPPPDPTV